MANNNKGMVTACFRNHEDAQNAFDFLWQRGYTDSEISVLMSDQTRAAHFSGDNKDRIPTGSLATEGMGVGGAIGTVTGAALAAILAAGSSLVIPGLNLVLVGPIAAALAGGGAGAVTGGVLGALIGYGIPEDNAKAYHETLREGGVVVGVVPRNSEDASAIAREFERLHGDSVCSNC